MKWASILLLILTSTLLCNHANPEGEQELEFLEEKDATVRLLGPPGFNEPAWNQNMSSATG